ncbi:MAG: energy transducer TonB [Xanthomonadales bacterium]|nr:energy transducer TonB [Xanthomonadales bacterium]
MAQSLQQVKKQAEASLVVTGHVDIEADGSVTGHDIDNASRLPDYVVALVDRAARGWRFEPLLVAGEPVPARARMNLRLVARPIADSDGDYEVAIANGWFGQAPGAATDEVSVRGKLSLPAYPQDMIRRRAEGTVYLAVKVGRDGSVEDVIAERVNLRVYEPEKRMARLRQRFADHAIRAAGNWRFNPPTTGDRVNDDFWVVIVPIDYALIGLHTTRGLWTQYVPGPLHPRPDWRQERSDLSGSDAMIAGQMQMAGGERRLLSALDDEPAP